MYARLRRFVNAGKLSGGNQQKVIVARELSRPVNWSSLPNRRAAWMSARSNTSTRRSS
jgi:hypothetical protein